MTANALNIILLTAMVATVFLILRLRSLFAVVMLGGIYSLLAALMFVIFDAVDVAFTEASVGAGIATVLYLATLSLTMREEAPGARLSARSALPLLAVCAAGALLIFATTDMPHFGDPQAPMHIHVVPRYLAEGMEATSVPNIVTAVLASYRGFDTLGETVVIFTAGIGVLALMWRFRSEEAASATLGGTGLESAGPGTETAVATGAGAGASAGTGAGSGAGGATAPPGRGRGRA